MEGLENTHNSFSKKRKPIIDLGDITHKKPNNPTQPN